jgi:hypothetical protein
LDQAYREEPADLRLRQFFTALFRVECVCHDFAMAAARGSAKYVGW